MAIWNIFLITILVQSKEKIFCNLLPNIMTGVNMMSVNPFQIKQEENNEAYILYISGDLDLAVVQQFRAVLGPVVKRPEKALILNLKNLNYIDSTGIGIIVSILKIRDGMHAPFIVQDIPPSIKRLFDLTGISGYLTEGTEA